MTLIQTSGWNFQLVKTVASAQGPVTNLVWQSQKVAPNTYISWTPQYGLNWSTIVPDKGLEITLTGSWQACNLGQVYDIDKEGYWQTSQSPPDPDFMKIGIIDVHYPGTDGIHIVVGIESSSGEWDPVFIDPVLLPVGSTAKYQPQEKMEWWYQAGERNGTIIDDDHTATGTADFSSPATYYWNTTFVFDEGQWDTTLGPHGGDSTSTQEDSAPDNIWRTMWTATLRFAASPQKQLQAEAQLKNLLTVRYKNVSVTFVDSLKLMIKLGDKKNGTKDVGVPNDDTKGEISASLEYVVKSGNLPADESWTIKEVK
jgi:hypothetical protein